MAEFLSEMEQENYSPNDFVERLAWRKLGGVIDADAFEPRILQDSFQQAIRDLHMLYENIQKRCERLELMCKDEETRHWEKIGELQEKHRDSYATYKDLDAHIGSVAAKVVHLGDLLESVNTPRARAVEAQQLIRHFGEFLDESPSNGGLLSSSTSGGEPGSLSSVTLLASNDVQTTPQKLYETADTIQKLHMIAQELPDGKFERAKQRIAAKYADVERALVDEFKKAHYGGNATAMHDVAKILTHFKGYNACVDTFIEQSQVSAFLGADPFTDVIPLLEKSESLIERVFSNPEHVMAKFVANIFQSRLKTYVEDSLKIQSDNESYLRMLCKLYSRTLKLCKDLERFKMVGDSATLNKLARQVFQTHLDNYINMETHYLREKYSVILTRYYDSKGHQKRQTGGFQDLRRGLQARIGPRVNIAPMAESFGGETFLSEELAINILQESKLAFERCHLLSKTVDCGKNASLIFDILLNSLCLEHIQYALDLGVRCIPLSELKSQPEIYFFDAVRQCNSICQLLEKQFTNCVVPLVTNGPEHMVCAQKKRTATDAMEETIQTGLERSLAAIIAWVHQLLVTEQKKTDFRPESEDVVIATNATPVSIKVCKYISMWIEKIRDSLDGKNVDAVLLELGVQFHRTIYEHIQTFQYSSSGTMVLLCDINEYRRCAKEFENNTIEALFDVLNALCNLLVVQRDHLKDVCQDERLAGLDNSILQMFVQLRVDSKNKGLAGIFK